MSIRIRARTGCAGWIVAAAAVFLSLHGSIAGAQRAVEARPISTEIPAALAAQGQVAPAPRQSGYRAGEAVPVSGVIGVYEPASSSLRGVATPFALELHASDGSVRGPFAGFQSGDQGGFSVALPGEATSGLDGGVYGVYVSQATAVLAPGDRAAVGSFTLAKAVADPVELQASFVSSTGWVKPGDSYPFRVVVRNNGDAAIQDLAVNVAPAPSTRHSQAVTLGDVGSVSVAGGGTVSWTLASLAAGESATLVIEAHAASLGEDPEVVWKDLSATAVLNYGGGVTQQSETHGPKVIPPAGGFESARYGDKPFPMILVEYVDPVIGKHQPQNTAEGLDEVVNSPDFDGSTFNLYQEMSYGQLYPNGTVPSAGIASAGWDYEPGFDFTSAEPGACPAVTLADVPGAIGSPLLPERIIDGWYQLPGQLHYYGWDDPIFPYTLLAGVPSVYSIDSGCGPTGKSVYDAAQIADPEIDYNDFDSDKDGVVDFFMLVFAGCGGNGGSQLAFEPGIVFSSDPCPYSDVPYDNIWPHSSSLEFSYADPETGLRGYISDDQLKSLKEVPQCWTDDNYRAYTDCAANGGSGDDSLPVYVRVGPYNVNPEDSFDAASVISHEYGHHLGLPDFYNQGSDFSAYASMNLMASDFGQNMTVFGKQDLGWVVPQYLQPGEEVTVENWSEIKTDTGEIRWQTPDGQDYVLSAANGDQNVHNGLAYAVKLPGRLLIDADKLANEASGTHAWYSGRGNDFGCHPQAGHNLDLFIPEMANVAAGEAVTLTFKSSWDIEWDWDYGFVLVTTDGETYQSLPSANGFTTDSVFNPNNAGCIGELNNGLTGTSGAYSQGEPFVTIARNPGSPSYDDGAPFLEDSYDLSAFAGQAVTVRFSYFTDPAFDRPGWFVDDMKVTAGSEVLYESDHESGEERGRYVPGGCSETFMTSVLCTDGWLYISSDAGNPADHAYFLELRDRSSFDFDGYGQSDRGQMGWSPGLFLEYTDENHGYGNNGASNHPAQHYLDSTPVPGGDCGSDCLDAAFTDTPGDNRFSDTEVWLDNFANPNTASGRWEFDYNCLSFEVLSMSGDVTVQLETDLVADVEITAGPGCESFEFGHVEARDATPPRATPVAAGGKGGALPWYLSLLILAWCFRRR